MNRAEALAYLNGAMDSVMTLAGRLTTDAVSGYKPALDRSFRIYIGTLGLDTTVTTTTTDASYDECFSGLLEGTAYDLVLPVLAGTLADISVDAPLMSIKRSQSFRQFQVLRDAAWARAASCGFGIAFDNVGGFRINMDFVEPGPCSSGQEWG
jgi:hypothetical protein